MDVFTDIIGYTGIAFIVAGAYSVHWGLAVAVLGAAMLGLSVAAAWVKADAPDVKSGKTRQR